MDISNASQMLSDLDLKITADNLSIDTLWFRAMVRNEKWGISRHMHSSYEFHFIKSGSCKIILDHNDFLAESGSIYITAPGVYHEQIGIGEVPFVEYSLNCDLKLINYSSSEFSTILNILSNAPCKSVPDLFHALDFFDTALMEIEYKRIGFFNTIKNLAVMIIIAAARDICAGDSINYEPLLKSKKTDHRFIMIEKYIKDNISNPITAKEISKFMYLSEKQILRIIYKEKGITTKELIDHIKLSRAKDLLRNTDTSVKQISENLGFSSEYYFSQFFRRYESCPPGAYRLSVKNV
ncbi:MAG TPA: AraC family transcriptional regulator [Caproiciproducens sp.]|nr:AraC family transcriptional regulator [Caproiciproducens sp.]